MVSVEAIKGWDDLLPFFVWTLVVAGLAQAVFRSFWALEFRSRIDRRWKQRLAAIRKAQHELRTGVEHVDGVEQTDPLVAKRKLGDAQARERLNFMRRAQRQTLPYRVTMYLLGCAFCQGFWTALAVQGFTPGVSGRVGWWLATAFAYATASAALVGLLARKPAAECPGGNCG